MTLWIMPFVPNIWPYSPDMFGHNTVCLAKCILGRFDRARVAWTITTASRHFPTLLPHRYYEMHSGRFLTGRETLRCNFIYLIECLFLILSSHIFILHGGCNTNFIDMSMLNDDKSFLNLETRVRIHTPLFRAREAQKDTMWILQSFWE